MRKKILGIMAALSLALCATSAMALPSGGGGDGGYMACFRCKHGGGWTPGSISWTQCEQSVHGEREACVVVGKQCVFSGGGCISLPDDPGTIGGILI
jgi:hypothetical protein